MVKKDTEIFEKKNKQKLIEYRKSHYRLLRKVL